MSTSTYNLVITFSLASGILLSYCLSLLWMSCDFLCIKKGKQIKTEVIIITLLVIAAAAIRFFALYDYPPGLAGDEIQLANDVRSTLKGTTSYRFATSGPPMLPSTPIVLFHNLFPRGRLAIRSYSMLCGTLSILAFYFLARICMPTLYAMIAALLLVLSPYHLLYSLALYGSRMVFMEIFILYFFITAINKRSFPRIILSASWAGILEYDYIGFTHYGVCILFLGLFLAWLLKRISVWNLVIYSLLVIMVVGTLIYPLYTLWLHQADHFWFSPFKEQLQNSHQIRTAIKNSFLMFWKARYGAIASIAQPNAQCLTIPLLFTLLCGLLACPFIATWPACFIGVGGIFSLLPSWLSSTQGNSHRAIM